MSTPGAPRRRFLVRTATGAASAPVAAPSGRRGFSGRRATGRAGVAADLRAIVDYGLNHPQELPQGR